MSATVIRFPKEKQHVQSIPIQAVPQAPAQHLRALPSDSYREHFSYRGSPVKHSYPWDGIACLGAIVGAWVILGVPVYCLLAFFFPAIWW